MEVIRIALQRQHQWRTENRCAQVSVNLSTRNLFHAGFYDELVALLREHAADPTLLEFEITETSLMQDPAAAASLLKRIADLGISLAIDDFGTGYSSLAYLRKLPLHALKIDRAFVQELAGNDQDQVIVRSIIALAHNLNLDVIAEGVEDASTLALLRTMGCDSVQGYFFARPQPAAMLDNWLQQYALSGRRTH
jgi:EAL domain-containing protein (putative c-di-GMP-specific phosphodiesterase class I)